MKRNGRFFFGVIVIVFGIFLLLEQASILPSVSKIFWEILEVFWPLILIFFGVKLLIDRNNVPGMILLVLGVVFLSSNMFTWDFFEILWPVILITLGITLLFKQEVKGSKKGINSKKEFSETVVFCGLEKKIKSENLENGEFNVAFGSLKLDLKDSSIQKDGAKVHLNCAFGDIEVYVPKDCRIKTEGTAFLGSWDSYIKDREVARPILEISGEVIFGSVKIKE
jgi:predicted membrane protein